MLRFCWMLSRKVTCLVKTHFKFKLRLWKSGRPNLASYTKTVLVYSLCVGAHFHSFTERINCNRLSWKKRTTNASETATLEMNVDCHVISTLEQIQINFCNCMLLEKRSIVTCCQLIFMPINMQCPRCQYVRASVEVTMQTSWAKINRCRYRECCGKRTS